MPCSSSLAYLCVSLTGREREQVAARDRLHYGRSIALQRLKSLPQPQDCHLQPLARSAGLRRGPQHIDQHITRHRSVGVQHQERKQPQLSRSAER
jgi:hypothetical protein